MLMVQRLCVQHVSGWVTRKGPACHSRSEMGPSKEDTDATNKITLFLKYVGVRVLDHIIVGLLGIAAHLMLTAPAAL